MHTSLMTMLVLVAWTRLGDEEAAPAPPAPRPVMIVSLKVGRDRREVSVSWPVPPPQADPDDDATDPRPRGPLNLNTASVEPENFDRWLFADDRSARERLGHLQSLLDTRIELADFVRRLTARDRAKLRLAGKGDIKRFLDLVEDRRNAFEVDRKGWKTGLAALQGLDPITRIYQEGPFGDGSLFAKTLRRIEGRASATR